jgi:hypothetical protein
VTSETEANPGPPGGEERRANPTLRRQVRDLLALIREFYQTCHMVAVGQLEPARAKAKARLLEEKLQVMMGQMLAEIDDEEADAGTGESDDD